MLYVMLFILLIVVSIGLTMLMISKYYWGPTGRPIEYRHHADETNDEEDAGPHAPGDTQDRP
ncbi:MAG TPA: hypothetical protein VEQ42_09640 [Pyrinomonadaceae bacterium]|nr:hypothetical protein [Pyrinomonadaceae bacterium]